MQAWPPYFNHTAHPDFVGGLYESNYYLPVIDDGLKWYFVNGCAEVVGMLH